LNDPIALQNVGHQDRTNRQGDVDRSVVFAAIPIGELSQPGQFRFDYVFAMLIVERLADLRSAKGLNSCCGYTEMQGKSAWEFRCLGNPRSHNSSAIKGFSNNLDEIEIASRAEDLVLIDGN